jgi:hypothetical protein
MSDDARQDLKATSDSIRRDAERLAEIERRKTELAPSDPRVDELSSEVERLVSDISDKAKAESELAESQGGGSPLNERSN